MKIIDPKVEIITEPDPLKRIELCGRVCYKSEDKITVTSARGFVERIIASGHTSVLEHARVVVPFGMFGRLYEKFIQQFTSAQDCVEAVPYGFTTRESWNYDGVLINARDFIAIGGTLDELEKLKNAEDYMTVRFTCDRAIANELVRHRVFSFSQESTRYVNYQKHDLVFIRPVPFAWAYPHTPYHNPFVASTIFVDMCCYAEQRYNEMIENGCKPQEARLVLPLATKTELIMTGTFKQWRTMMKLRSDNSAHPQMRHLMRLIREQMPAL